MILAQDGQCDERQLWEKVPRHNVWILEMEHLRLRQGRGKTETEKPDSSVRIRREEVCEYDGKKIGM